MPFPSVEKRFGVSIVSKRKHSRYRSRPLARLGKEQESSSASGEARSRRGLDQQEPEVTNDRPWRLADLRSFHRETDGKGPP
jgi:hypothetical protein